MKIEILNVRDGGDAGDLELSYNCTEMISSVMQSSAEIQIYKVLELRDHWAATLPIETGNDGSARPLLKLSHVEPGLYKIVRAGTRTIEDPMALKEHQLSGHLHFDYPVTKSDQEVSQEINEIQARRVDIIRQEVAVGEPSQGAPTFTAAIYFSGIKLNYPFALRGAEVYPIRTALGSEGIEQPLASDLKDNFGINVSFSDVTKSKFSFDNQLFAVKFFRLKADNLDLAADYAEEQADQISMLISLERGEKAKHCGTYIGGEQGGYFYPVFDGYRGNIAAPMFSDEHVARVERYQPIIQRSEYAKLLLTLLNEAVGERTLSFQYWRCWLIIEQISKKHVSSDTIILTNPDGSQILNTAGKPAKTSGARGKVFKYLIDIAWPEMSLLKPDASGMPPLIEGAQPVTPGAGQTKILLWDALGAVYSIRNKVAHTGHATRSAQPSPEEILATTLSEDGPFLMSFLYRLTANAVWREVNAE